MDITSFLIGYKKGLSSGGGSSSDVRYVTFNNYDGTYIGTKPVAVGDDCRYIFGTPTKPSTAQYSYSHNGWSTTQNGSADSNALKAVNEDRTLYATYRATVRSYTVTYYDEDGVTVLKTETLAYGATPSYTPTKTGYQFDGWTPALTTVTGDASYTSAWTEINETLTGTFASGATWKLIVIGTTAQMILSGSGAMDDYTGKTQQPWAEHRDKINSLSIGSDITTIGKYAFDSCKNITEVTIPSKVTKIGDCAFQGCIGITQLTLNEGLVTIGFRAFYAYTVSWALEKYPLGSIVIPSTVTQIWGGAFSGFSISSATFNDPVGWEVHANGMTQSTGWTKLTEANLSNPATAANYLDKQYHGHYWKKK